jgi:hypothetical protein
MQMRHESIAAVSAPVLLKFYQAPFLNMTALMAVYGSGSQQAVNICIKGNS